MKTGVYRKTEGRTGVGQLYEFDCLTRHHTTGQEMVVYVPLRIEKSWAGTVRHCVIDRVEFERKFEYVGEGLPTELPAPARYPGDLGLDDDRDGASAHHEYLPTAGAPASHPMPAIDNKFLVGGAGSSTIVFMRPVPQRLSHEDALLLAAWLVAIVGNEQAFKHVLQAVQNT